MEVGPVEHPWAWSLKRINMRYGARNSPHDHGRRPTLSALLAHGVDTIYALPGVHNDHFFDALAKANSRTIAPRKFAPSIPATSRPPPIWRWARRWPPASRRPSRGAWPGPAERLGSAAHRLWQNAPVLALVGQIPQRHWPRPGPPP